MYTNLMVRLKVNKVKKLNERNVNIRRHVKKAKYNSCLKEKKTTLYNLNVER